jgi:hypothetical protein
MISTAISADPLDWTSLPGSLGTRNSRYNEYNRNLSPLESLKERLCRHNVRRANRMGRKAAELLEGNESGLGEDELKLKRIHENTHASHQRSQNSHQSSLISAGLVISPSIRIEAPTFDNLRYPLPSASPNHNQRQETMRNESTSTKQYAASSVFDRDEVMVIKARVVELESENELLKAKMWSAQEASDTATAEVRRLLRVTSSHERGKDIMQPLEQHLQDLVAQFGGAGISSPSWKNRTALSLVQELHELLDERDREINSLKSGHGYRKMEVELAKLKHEYEAHKRESGFMREHISKRTTTMEEEKTIVLENKRLSSKLEKQQLALDTAALQLQDALVRNESLEKELEFSKRNQGQDTETQMIEVFTQTNIVTYNAAATDTEEMEENDSLSDTERESIQVEFLRSENTQLLQDLRRASDALAKESEQYSELESLYQNQLNEMTQLQEEHLALREQAQNENLHEEIAALKMEQKELLREYEELFQKLQCALMVNEDVQSRAMASDQAVQPSQINQLPEATSPLLITSSE